MPLRFTKPALERFVSSQVASGAFPDVDAVLEEAVARMMDEESPELTPEDWKAIEEADAQIERGECVDFATFAKEMRKKYGLRS